MPQLNPNSTLKIWEPFLLALCLSIGMFVGYDLFEDKSDLLLIDSAAKNKSLGIGRVEEILRVIENSYVDHLKSDELVENAITNLINKLDPHSHYINEQEFEDYNQKMSGVYKGMGVESKFINDTLYVCHSENNEKHSKDGLKAGDRIIVMDGDTISGRGKNMNDILRLLKEVNDEFINLEIIRSNNNLNVNISLKEQTTSSADLNYVIQNRVGVVRISRFSANTYDQFFKSLESISKKLERDDFDLIIDLRNNPGGYVPQTLRILSQLFSAKNLLLSFTEGENRKRKEYKSTGRNFYNIGQIVVLINENSASASEIIAGAIQDWDRGVVIGQSSYGKGLVQELFPLKNGGAIRLTIARYGTPSGRFIQKPYTVNGELRMVEDSIFETKKLGRQLKNNNGITPDLEVEPRISFDSEISDFVVSKILPFYDSVSYKELVDPNFDAIETFNLYKVYDHTKNELLITELIYAWHGPLMYYQFVNSADPTFAKASEVILSSNPLYYLASEED